MKFTNQHYIGIVISILLFVLLMKKTTSNNKSISVGNGKKQLVLFYENWCGHSVRMLPEWEKLENENTNGVEIKKVVCSTDRALCQKEKIKGFPTVKYYNGNGGVFEYNGDRTKDGFMSFLSENN